MSAVVKNTVPAATPLTRAQLDIYNTIEVSKKLGIACDLKPTWEYYSKFDLRKAMKCEALIGVLYNQRFYTILSDLYHNLKWNADYGFSGIYNENIFREIFSDPKHLEKLLTCEEVLVKHKEQIQWLSDNGYFPEDNESVKQIFDLYSSGLQIKALLNAIKNYLNNIPNHGCANSRFYTDDFYTRVFSIRENIDILVQRKMYQPYLREVEWLLENKYISSEILESIPLREIVDIERKYRDPEYSKLNRLENKNLEISAACFASNYKIPPKDTEDIIYPDHLLRVCKEVGNDESGDGVNVPFYSIMRALDKYPCCEDLIRVRNLPDSEYKEPTRAELKKAINTLNILKKKEGKNASKDSVTTNEPCPIRSDLQISAVESVKENVVFPENKYCTLRDLGSTSIKYTGFESDDEDDSEILKNLEEAEKAVLEKKPQDHDIKYLLLCISDFKKMVLKASTSGSAKLDITSVTVEKKASTDSAVDEPSKDTLPIPEHTVADEQPSAADVLDIKAPIYVCTTRGWFGNGTVDDPCRYITDAVLKCIECDQSGRPTTHGWQERILICDHEDYDADKKKHVHKYHKPTENELKASSGIKYRLHERTDWTDPESVGRFENRNGFTYPVLSDSPCPLAADQLKIANTMEIAKKLGQPCDLKPTWEYYTNYDLQKILDLAHCGTYWAGFKATLSDLSKNLKWNRDYEFSRIYNEEIFRKMFSFDNLKKLVRYDDLVEKYKMELMWLIGNGYISQDDESVKTMCDIWKN